MNIMYSIICAGMCKEVKSTQDNGHFPFSGLQLI